MCGVIRDFVNFPHLVSFFSCHPTFLRISIHSLSELKLKWDKSCRISSGSLLFHMDPPSYVSEAGFDVETFEKEEVCVNLAPVGDLIHLD